MSCGVTSVKDGHISLERLINASTNHQDVRKNMGSRDFPQFI